MRLGRLLGSLQDPVWVMDTSFLVKFGQHDYGAITQTMTARKETANYFAGQNKDKIYVQFMILDRVGKEYKRLYTDRVPGDYKIPKASVDLLAELELTEFPPYLRDMIGPAKMLWQTDSDKDSGKRVLDDVSKTDMEIVAYSLEQAENRRSCWVFSYDEHIAGRISELERENPSIRLARESAQNADTVMKTIGAKHKPIFLPPWIAGEFYKTPTCVEAVRCVTTAKVPFAGREEEFVVSVNPVADKLNFKDGNVSRYVLYSINVDDIEDSSGHKRAMFLDRLKKTVRRASKDLINRHPSASILTAKKSQKSGVLRLGKIDLHTYYSGGKFERSSEESGLDWFMVDDAYLQRFSPETLEHLRDARRRLVY